MLNKIVGAIGARHFIDVNFEQPSNTQLPIEVTESPRITEVNPVQSLNACSPIEVTEFGINMEVNPEQPPNA